MKRRKSFGGAATVLRRISLERLTLGGTPPMSPEVERRNHARYELPSMYTTVCVVDADGAERCGGHAYDISQGGMRFELDDALEPGSTVQIRIDLPGGNDRTVLADVNILWVEEEDVELEGPVRMAGSFAGFSNEEDATRLKKMLRRGRYHLAA